RENSPLCIAKASRASVDLSKSEHDLSEREVSARQIERDMFCARFRACAVRDAALGFARRDVALNTWETPNGLESSEDRGSAGGHGNQHVRLRFAQVRPPDEPAAASMAHAVEAVAVFSCPSYLR